MPNIENLRDACERMLIDEHDGYMYSEELLRSQVVYSPTRMNKSFIKPITVILIYTLKTLIAECSLWDSSFSKTNGREIIPDTGSSIAAGLVLADCSITVLNVLASDCFPHHIQLFGAHLQFTYAADEARDIPNVVVQLREGWNTTKERGAKHHLSIGRKKGDIC